MSEIVTASAFLQRRLRRFTEVEVKDFGLVRIRSITERERALWERHAYDTKGNVNVDRLQERKARLVALCVCDQAGDRILSDNEAAQLLDMDAAILDRVYTACAQHADAEAPDYAKKPDGSAGTSDAGSP